MSWSNPFAPAGSNGSGLRSAMQQPGTANGSLALPLVKRTASMCSLPSPPADYGEDGMDVDDGLQDAPKVPPFGPGAGLGGDMDDQVDQLESDDDEPVAPVTHHGRTKPRASRPCMLGSPAVLFGGGGAPGLASRKQLLNPFLPPAASTSASSAPHAAGHSHGAPLSPSASPVRPHVSPSRRRHRPDPDRIRLTTPPPRPSPAELEAERARVLQEERRRAMGWDDPANPFVERDGEMARRIKDKKPMQRPETITYVKRGQRIKTSVPFTAVLTSSSPSDDPFTFTAPKLLFPPAQPPSPTMPSTPPKQSKFLEALRAVGAGAKKGDGAGDELPPTPATLKRKAPAAAGDATRVPQYKRMRAVAEGSEPRGLR